MLHRIARYKFKGRNNLLIVMVIVAVAYQPVLRASAEVGSATAPVVVNHQMAAEAASDSLKGLPFPAGRLREALREGLPTTFGGVYYEDRVLHITDVGDQPAVERAAQEFALAEGTALPPVQYDGVDQSLAELEEDAATIGSKAEQKLSELGVRLAGYGPDESTNEVRVEVVNATDAETSQAVDHLTRDLGVKDVNVVSVPGVPAPDADRGDDSSPWNAGDRIYDENAIVPGDNQYGACSSGFGVHNSAGTTYLLTAGHCSNVPGQFGYFWNGVKDDKRRHGMGFTKAVAFGDQYWDSQLIDTRSSRITWTATATRSDVVASYEPIMGDDNMVINEGATSVPWLSGLMTVTKVSWCQVIGPYNVWGYVTICHLHEATPGASNRGSRGGDSGGPIVFYSGYGPLAVGTVVAGMDGMGLGGRMYYHPVDAIFRNGIYNSAVGALSINR